MVKRTAPIKSDSLRKVFEWANKYGGMRHAHVHGDRAFTRDPHFYEQIGLSPGDFGRLTLPEKQKLTWALHTGPAFKKINIERRARRLFDESLAYGIVRIDSTVDVTYNTGMKSFEVMEQLKTAYAEKGLDIRLGAYNTSGFKTGKKYEERFKLFEEAAERSDFLMGLAEKDRNKKESHIGERQHNWYMLQLAHRLGKPVQFHVGQENRPTDKTLDLLVEDVELFQDMNRLTPLEAPEVTAVHAISTANDSYEEMDTISQRMIKRNIGLITCPSAAISMKQDRTMTGPIHNSIAPVMRMAWNGVHIRGLGVDNVDDVYIPGTNPDVLDEALLLSQAERIYNARVLGKMLAGEPLDAFDKERIAEEKGF